MFINTILNQISSPQLLILLHLNLVEMSVAYKHYFKSNKLTSIADTAPSEPCGNVSSLLDCCWWRPLVDGTSSTSMSSNWFFVPTTTPKPLLFSLLSNVKANGMSDACNSAKVSKPSAVSFVRSYHSS